MTRNEYLHRLKEVAKLLKDREEADRKIFKVLDALSQEVLKEMPED